MQSERSEEANGDRDGSGLSFFGVSFLGHIFGRIGLVHLPLLCTVASCTSILFGSVPLALPFRRFHAFAGFCVCVCPQVTKITKEREKRGVLERILHNATTTLPHTHGGFLVRISRFPIHFPSCPRSCSQMCSLREGLGTKSLELRHCEMCECLSRNWKRKNRKKEKKIVCTRKSIQTALNIVRCIQTP